MKLIHSDKDIGEDNDPYDFDEKNPYESRAFESSLWEVQTLAQHYYANVSTLAKIFSEKFLKPKYDLEDFLDHTYATVSLTISIFSLLPFPDRLAFFFFFFSSLKQRLNARGRKCLL